MIGGNYMPNWGKQTRLLHGVDSLDERIDIIQTWASELDHSKLVKFLKSSFRTLNNPNRYKYYMQPDTTTHEKFLTFLIVLKLMSKRADDKDYIRLAVGNIDINRSKEWLTLYYIFKVYLLKDKDLRDIKISVSESDVDDLKHNAASGGSEFSKFSFYDHMDLIKDCLKSMKKGTLIVDDNPKRDYNQLILENKELKKTLKRVKKYADKEKIKIPTCGELVSEMYERRNKIDNVKVKKKSKKKKLLDKW